MQHITIIHGPNLNLLGKRQPDIYGAEGFDTFMKQLQEKYTHLNIGYFQSNVEGELINHIQQCDSDGIILNAGGYAHTSIALADAVAAVSTPVVNVHISNIYSREKERHTELLAQYCVGGIYGMGLEGYKYALDYLTNSNTYE